MTDIIMSLEVFPSWYTTHCYDRNRHGVGVVVVVTFVHMFCTVN